MMGKIEVYLLQKAEMARLASAKHTKHAKNATFAGKSY